MHTSLFMVHNEPYCLWGFDIQQRNVRFLNGFDTRYFEFVAQAALESEDDKRASVLLYTTLHQATETLFSLIGAYVQAPDCAYAWIAKCQNVQLRNLVTDIQNCNSSIFIKLNIAELSWQKISERVFAMSPYDEERNAKIISHFSNTWKRLASEFLDETHQDQYNCLKHGLRVQSGGFRISIAEESKVDGKPGEFHELGGSDYGMTFQKISNIWPERKSRSIKYTNTSVNWSIDKIVGQINLVNCSIQNVVSALKFFNGVPSEECKLSFPTEDSAFDYPWENNVPVSNFTVDFTVDTTNTKPVTASEIKDIIFKE